MINAINFALNAIKNNPEIANNPRNRAMAETLERGNAEEIINLANNICETYGVTFDDAAKQSMDAFNF